MDKSAIEQIQQAEATNSVNSAIKNFAGLAYPLVAVPNDFKTECLERYLPNKVRFTGTLKTNSLNDFTSFSLAHKQDGSKCFINSDNEEAVVIFNLGDDSKAGHADFKAFLKLEKTAEYKALLEKHDRHLNQKQLAEFMEDWADYIVALNSDGAAISTSKAISAVRRITIEAKAEAKHEVQDFRSTRSALENVEAKTDHGLPSEILFKCVPFNELPEFEFYARISIITGEEPKFSFRIKRLEKIQDDIMNEFKRILVQELNEQIPAYLGVFNC